MFYFVNSPRWIVPVHKDEADQSFSPVQQCVLPLATPMPEEMEEQRLGAICFHFLPITCTHGMGSIPSIHSHFHFKVGAVPLAYV